ncbi:carboxylesterase family protein [Paenibacillus guangzhouensis]|uniref:carboxylesterase family protein n=1 Tax=Paenibacillus guangzhouensis TaxID=1473112 RepID=UPI001266934F|nr:prolyl oligopeptidase family serine peptidase [Paenibacillus guangzhouensis]
MKQAVAALHKEIVKTVDLQYVVYTPADFDPDAGKKWPLIYFLHGINQRGADIELVKKYGIPNNLEAGEELPFIVVCPQCPAGSFWPLENDGLMALLGEIVEQYPVDRDRIYLTGYSMGGYGTWDLALNYPDTFAAAAPVCGGLIPGRNPESLKSLPIWTFHGDQDSVVPIQESKLVVQALQSMGSSVQFTIYPGVDHDSWTETYRNPALYAWFLQHTRAAQ